MHDASKTTDTSKKAAQCCGFILLQTLDPLGEYSSTRKVTRRVVDTRE